MYTGANVVSSESLILNIDGANIKSYPGSGTTWVNMAIDQPNGTFVNGAVYSSFGIGSVFIDGTNDYVDFGTNNVWNFGANDFTIDTWVYRTGGTGNGSQGIFSTFLAQANVVGVHLGLTGFRPQFRIGDDFGGPLVAVIDSNTLPTGVWTHLCAVRRSNFMYLYRNSVLVGGPTAVSLTVNQSLLRLGIWYNNLIAFFFGGYISNMRAYRGIGLTQEQVIQNYIAQKGRYGF